MITSLSSFIIIKIWRIKNSNEKRYKQVKEGKGKKYDKEQVIMSIRKN